MTNGCNGRSKYELLHAYVFIESTMIELGLKTHLQINETSNDDQFIIYFTRSTL